jgi:hypothetical protein
LTTNINPLTPSRIKNYDEVLKGLDGLLKLYNTMANEGISYKFGRKNEPLSWRLVIYVLDLLLLV